MNIWNYRSASQKLNFINKVEEQKKHLLNLFKIKTATKNRIVSSAPYRINNKNKPNYSINSSRLQEQNHKLLTRLVLVKPTINHQVFKKSNFSNKIYKQNIIKSKYKYPDFSKEASKIICGKKPHLSYLSFRNNIHYKSQSNIINKGKSPKFLKIR